MIAVGIILYWLFGTFFLCWEWLQEFEELTLSSLVLFGTLCWIVWPIVAAGAFLRWAFGNTDPVIYRSGR